MPRQVFFHECQAVQWPHHWESWRDNATLTLAASAVLDGSLLPLQVLKELTPQRIGAMRASIAANAHRLQYSTSDTVALRGLLPAEEPWDAFDVTLQLAFSRSRAQRLVEKGKALQRGAGDALDKAVAAFYEQTRPEHAGVCRDMTGAWDAAACDASPAAVATKWGPPRPLASRALSIEACRERCRKCARCSVFSFSQLQGVCQWTHTCHRADLTNLDRRYEFWTFRTERLSGHSTNLSAGASSLV